MRRKEFSMCKLSAGIVVFLCLVLLFPFEIEAQNAQPTYTKPVKPNKPTPKELPASPVATEEEVVENVQFNGDSLNILSKDTVPVFNEEPIVINTDSIAKATADKEYYGKEITFNPNPNRAVWLSALFPGLGQVYNRRYWKLPLVVGGFMGISYAMSWNEKMLTDYTMAYRDAMDSDPNTKSYMDFYPPTTKEEDINMEWLKKSLKSKKDFYRRNRDLSIICMVGVYLVCMVDAYVDASLSQFDITPDLSMQFSPAFIENNRNGIPSVGVQCALKF